MTCYSPLKGFEDKENGGIVFKRSDNAGKAIDLSCGQCLGCRIDRSKTWAARIVHEAHMHRENCFITLTYDQEHLPWDGSLVKSHFQKFMKRLRKHYNDKKIRYFHCGEYGEKLSRPHYHACLFGIDFPDRRVWSSRNDVVTYQSDTLEKIWGKGFCTVGELEYESAAYCSRYILKKITGVQAERHYERVIVETGEIVNIEPEYITMSLKPGIGHDFYQKYKTDFLDDTCPVPGRGVYQKIPGYYETLLSKTDPDTIEKIKRARRRYFQSKKSDYSARRLLDRMKVKQAQIKTLTRSYES